MKRILFLTFYFRPDLCAGSFRNSPLLDELSRHTREENIQIDVFTTAPNRYSSFNRGYLPVEEYENVRIERIDIPSHKNGMKDQALSFKTYYLEVLEKTKPFKYDLVYGSSSRFFTSYLAYRIAKRNQCPLYIDVRDIFSETFSEAAHHPLLQTIFPPFISLLEYRVYSYASHINLISEGFTSSFENYPAASFSYYTHGVDPIFLTQSKTGSVANKTDKKKSKKKVLYAGNIGQGQGLHKIIPYAAKKLELTHEFEIIGDGGAMDRLVSALNKENVKNVILTSPVDRKELAQSYYNADILFIHLNDYDIFKKVLPSKIFELAVIGKPILAGVDGYSASFLRKNVPHSFIFDPCDIRGLTNQIKNIEQQENLVSSDDISLFIKKFSREIIDREMAKSINELI